MGESKNSDFVIRKKTVAVAFFVLILLITGAFFTGMFLGLNSKPEHFSYAKEDVFRERFDACSYKVQLLTGKLTTLIEKMKSLGLLKEDGSFSEKIFCDREDNAAVTVEKEKEEVISDKAVKTVAAVKDQKVDENKKQPDNAKDYKQKEKKIDNKDIDMLDRIMSELEEFDSSKKVKQKETAKTENDDTKNVKPSAIQTSCLYTLQFFSSKSRGDAENALKLYSSFRDSILVEGVAKGDKWFRVRSGCYKTIEEAKTALEDVKKRIPNATVMKNR